MASLPLHVRALIAAAALALLLLAIPAPAAAQADPACAQTGAETVTTDKPRYPVEALVHISGSGYAPGCDVIVRVVRPDGSIVTGDGTETTGSDIVRTDASGGLTYDYRLNTISGTYRVYVVDPVSGDVLASVEFEDAAIIDDLRLGATGAENYVFTAGDRVDAAGTVANSRHYRWTVIRSDGTTVIGPCASTIGSPPGPTSPVTGSYTVQASDPVSTSQPYTYRLDEFGNTDSTCTAGSLSVDTRTFSVARLSSFEDSALNVPRTAFGLGHTAYARVDGVTTSQADWSATWIPPSGSTSCANTLGTDRADSSVNGRFPDAAGSFLQYQPNGSGDTWNLSANYDGGASCPAFAPSNDGQWRLRLALDATHFVEMPAFIVDTTAPATTINSGPSGTTSNASPSFDFSSDEPGSTFRCKLDGPGATTGSYAACTSPRSYASLAEGSYTFSVYATDIAGNVDATPATRSFTVDTIAPAVTLAQPADNSATNDTTPPLSGAAGDLPGDGATVTVNLYAGATPSGSPVRTFAVTRSGAVWSVANGDWNAGVPLRAPLPEGVYTARAEQSDAVSTTQSNTRTFRVDTTPPNTTDNVPAPTQPDVITVTLTAVDSGSGVATTYYTTDDTNPANPSNPSRQVYNPASKPVLKDGEQIRYYSVDLAGNAEPVRISGIAKIDRGDPIVENDGDQDPGNGTSLTGPASSDWLGLWDSGCVATMVDPQNPDGYFAGGTKEEAPMSWSYLFQMGGVTPAKSNIQAAWTATEPTRSTTFLYLAFKREGTTGNTFLTFELNQGDDSYVNSAGATVPCRQNGDILASFETGSPPRVTLYRWVSTAPGPPSCPEGAIGTFVSSGPLPPSFYQGRMNTVPIANHLDTGQLGTSFPTNSFGEAGIDLPAVLNAMTGSPCAAYVRVHVHSRSSESIGSQLQDNVGPYPINIQSCSVTGTKFEDMDADGVRDSGEPGIGGFRIYVDLDGNGSLDAGEPTDVTDVNGAYELTSVPAGFHEVREQLTPAQVAEGWTCSKPEDACTKVIEQAMGGNNSNIVFGNWKPATVSGKKFVDGNRNGFQDGPEGPLAGGTVYVDYDDSGTWDAGEPLAVTAADGKYTIGGIRPGSYPIRQEPLPGYICTAPSASCAHPPTTFTSSAVVTDRDFADAPFGRVSGTKFEDVDADGVRDAGEPGLAGWTVYVDYDGDGSLDAGEPSDVTDGAGDYSIDDVRAPATHRVREVAQGGWTASMPQLGYYELSFVAESDFTQRDFGAWRPGTITGTVWHDLDEDATRDPGEPGIGGWTVYADYDGNGVQDAGEPTGISAGNGAYSITGVKPGSYSVREVVLGGWRCMDPVTCEYSGVVVQSGATVGGRDFGNATSTTVSGTKWADHDRDGVQDAGEPGLAGWTVYVDYDGDDTLGPLEPSAVTDANGDYTIARVTPNTPANPYAVREIPQTSWTCSAPMPACEWDGLVIAAGTAEGDRDFGAYMAQSISGRTFEDRDADGVEGPADGVRANITVWAETIADNGVIDPGEPSAVSDARGDYVIPDVLPGSFKVRELTGAGWTCSVPTGDANGCFRSLVLAPGANEQGVDFGAWEPASVSGTVYDDVDRDGTRDVNEVTAAGATVVVETVNENGAADPGEPTAVTGANGAYSIGGLPPRAIPYRVVMLPPAAHTCTAPLPGCEHLVALSSGDAADGRDFGLVAEAEVSGTQFEDLDADGTRDAGEAALSGWTMWVDYDNDGTRDGDEPSDVTDPSGAYSIGQVRVGDFRVRQEPTAGWTCSSPASCSYLETFSAGTALAGRDFGAWRPATVSGTVFHDVDRNAARDVAEPGLGTWTVVADYDGDDVRDDDEPYIATAGDGTYTIPGVRPGTWQVREELQGLYACTTPLPCEHSVTVTSGGASNGNDFGNAEPGLMIEGNTFHDVNGDGAPRTFDPLTGDPTEPVRAGRQVWLETVAANGVADPGEPTAVTNAFGDYSFRNLNPGSYAIRHDVGSGWTCSYPAGCEWSASGAPGDSIVAQDFGAWSEPGIAGRVYEDLNADGNYDTGELYLNGWRVYLDVNDDGDFDNGIDPYAISTTVAGDDGVYQITGIVPDGETHEVREEPPSGSWECSEPGNATSGTDCTRSFLNVSEASQTGDFGNFRTVTIAGVKYEDHDADGDRDLGEPGMGGRTITLDPGTPGDASDDVSVVTAGDGSYSFPGLTPGITYRVSDAGQAGWTCSEPGAGCDYTIPTESGDGTIERDFGSWRPVAIGGTKYEDSNADGDRDAGEPALGGREIKLDPATPGDASDDLTTTTAGDGSYGFAGLTPGVTYRVYDEGESGWICSQPGSPCEYAVATASGDGTITRDFGAYREVSIAGTKYDDLNADGDRDGGEPPSTAAKSSSTRARPATGAMT